MKTPDEMTGEIKTRGDFRALSERALQDSGHGSESRQEIPTDHPVWEVWDAIKQTWPTGTARWADEPLPAWVYALEEFTPNQIAAGVRRMVKQGGTFAPSAPEFVKYVRDEKTFEEAQQARQASQPDNLLTYSPPKEERLAGIRKLREEHGL